jgi:hypothetical protein
MDVIRRDLQRTWAFAPFVTAVIGFATLLTACNRIGSAGKSPAQSGPSAGYAVLVYQIEMQGHEGVPHLAEDLIAYLQKTIDPRREHGLQWRVVAPDQIEVKMPLPPREVWRARQAYIEAWKAIQAAALDQQTLCDVLSLREGRTERLQELARALPEREPQLTAAAAAFDRYDLARSARQAASAPSSSQTAPTSSVSAESLAQQEEDARFELEESIDAVVDASIPMDHFPEILAMRPDDPVRAEQIAKWCERLPSLRGQILTAQARYDVWRTIHVYMDDPYDLEAILAAPGALDLRILVEPKPEEESAYERYRRQLIERGTRRDPADAWGWFRIDNPRSFFTLGPNDDLRQFEPQYWTRDVAARMGTRFYVLARVDAGNGLLTSANWHLESAAMDRDEHGRWSAIFQIGAECGQTLEDFTRAHIGQALCILVDDVAYAAPNIRSPIRTRGQITGDFTKEKAEYLVQALQAGGRPARLKPKPVSEQIVETAP